MAKRKRTVKQEAPAEAGNGGRLRQSLIDGGLGFVLGGAVIGLAFLLT